MIEIDELNIIKDDEHVLLDSCTPNNSSYCMINHIWSHLLNQVE